MSERRDVARAKRVVVKIGSRTLASDDAIYERLARAVARARTAGRAVVVVSSGAIALGTVKLGYGTRPTDMAKLQAAAAAGQTLLMGRYEAAFGALGVPAAQVLLTHADLADRARANNARAALAALLDAGAVPVLNENDSVAVDEIKFGDNDQLAAMVASLIDADLLVLLSDVSGLLGVDGVRVPLVRDVAREAMPLVKAQTSVVGTGGMASKLEAARRATLGGTAVVVADARRADVVDAVLAGEDVGTLFVPASSRLSARKYWIAFILRPKGDVVLDEGAAGAVATQTCSVLGVGVLGVRGRFAAGDAVRILDGRGRELGRGLARCAAADALVTAGIAAKGGEGSGDARDPVIVHKDDLVIWTAD